MEHPFFTSILFKLSPSRFQWLLFLVQMLQSRASALTSTRAALSPGFQPAWSRLVCSRACRGAVLRRERKVVLCLADAGVTKQSNAQWIDEYSDLRDREDVEPLALPSITSARRVVVVRHGQSTWNAEGRIQGSSDDAVLTPLGVSQAQTTREMLASENFDMLINSPLKRASQTADIVWGDRQGPRRELPGLREIDLYSFQGLVKGEGKEQFGDLFSDWQKRPWEFVIDEHPPVRELWYRASLAWRDILSLDESYSTLLVVAHNAVNQALICTALGLPSSSFRRLLQSNAATSVIDFQPSLNASEPPRVTLNRLNQSPEAPFRPSGAGRAAKSRIILMRNGGTESSEVGLVVGKRNEPCSNLGEVHAQKTAELLLDLECDGILSSPMDRAKASAEIIAKYQPLVGHDCPSIHLWDELLPWDAGEWEMQAISKVRGEDFPPSGEPFPILWERVDRAWSRLIDYIDNDDTNTVVVSGHSLVLAGLLGCCLGMDRKALPLFRHDLGGISVIDFPDGPKLGGGVLRCANYSAHLGRWAVPVTMDDWELVCGIDGCF